MSIACRGPGLLPRPQDWTAEDPNSLSPQGVFCRFCPGQGPNESPHCCATENPRENRSEATAGPRSPHARLPEAEASNVTGEFKPSRRSPADLRPSRAERKCLSRRAPHRSLAPWGPRSARSPHAVFNVLKPRAALLPPAPSAAPTGQRPRTWLATDVVASQPRLARKEAEGGWPHGHHRCLPSQPAHTLRQRVLRRHSHPHHSHEAGAPFLTHVETLTPEVMGRRPAPGETGSPPKGAAGWSHATPRREPHSHTTQVGPASRGKRPNHEAWELEGVHWRP